MNLEIIFVENIKCGGCMSSIKETIKKLDGVSDVTIDKDLDQVTVSGENINREAIVDKLAHLGYPEKGNNNAFAKVKSYISCAIGNMTSKETDKNHV
jgi:copper chaperone